MKISGEELIVRSLKDSEFKKIFYSSTAFELIKQATKVEPESSLLKTISTLFSESYQYPPMLLDEHIKLLAFSIE